jgi:hypothetical protein
MTTQFADISTADMLKALRVRVRSQNLVIRVEPWDDADEEGVAAVQALNEAGVPTEPWDGADERDAA